MSEAKTGLRFCAPFLEIQPLGRSAKTWINCARILEVTEAEPENGSRCRCVITLVDGTSYGLPFEPDAVMGLIGICARGGK